MLTSQTHLAYNSSKKEIPTIGENTVNHQSSHKRRHFSPLVLTSLSLLCTLTLLAIALQPFFAIKTRECSRLAFSLTIYKFAEASTEYDGQCIQKP